ncbi:MAG TPA: Pycsar system effector family protein [Sphingobium sp.]|uniref:Pycsar system effector family protein n=1 Tax=Sphingobium sp. TaxID=1912891 RepID=UPI002ED14491
MSSLEPRPARPFPPNAIHLVRTSQQMQLQLSQMADQKASMLMGATFLVFTLSVGQLRAGGGMMLPVALLAASAFLSALFAILTVLPKVTRLDGADVGADANLLFFGIFTALPEAAFIDRVLDRMESDETIYRTMLRDMHQAGSVLQRKKYRYLGYAYRVFLTGMVLTAIAAAAELATGRFI